MKFSYKEISDYKFIFDDDTEFILDTVTNESVRIVKGQIEFQFYDALINKELIEKIHTHKVIEVQRILTVRDADSGKDVEQKYILLNPTVSYFESNYSENIDYRNVMYSVCSMIDQNRKSYSKFEIV